MPIGITKHNHWISASPGTIDMEDDTELNRFVGGTKGTTSLDLDFTHGAAAALVGPDAARGRSRRGPVHARRRRIGVVRP